MKRLLAVLVFLLLLTNVLALTPQEAMMEAWKTGDYSLVEPYLSPAMKAAFSKSVFQSARKELVERYGEIKSYQPIKEEKEKGYEVYYYRINAENGAYTVSVAVKNGKVEGFHVVSTPMTQNGHTPPLTPQGAMMEAWKSGNYSIVEPYLGPEMKKALPERAFKVVKEELIREYGQIKGYELKRTEEKDGYQIYYYRVIAEKGNYTVSVTVKDGKVEGFHFAPKFNPEKALYPLLGGLLGLLLLWAYLRKFHAGELILGAVLLIPVLIFQPLVQGLPGFLGMSNTAFLVAWTGLIAALFQEPLKYYFSRDKTLGRALYVGVGFGIGEAIYVAVMASLGGSSLIGAVERALALLFHASTTVLFAYSYRNGWGRWALLVMILVHWITDSIAAYWHVSPSNAVLLAGYAVMLLTALAILPKLLPLARAESEEPEVRW